MLCRKGVSCIVFAVTVLAFVGSLIIPAQAGDFVLVRDGKPVATIVTAADPTDVAAFSAYELQYHVQKITGATLPIKTDADKIDGTRILVGPSAAVSQLGIKADDLKDQAYVIRFVDNGLVLLGNDSPQRTKGISRNKPVGLFEKQATSYAVHDFLERFCDVRWYGPGELEMVLPKTSTLAVATKDVQRRPAFSYRSPWGPMEILTNQWNHASGDEINLFYARQRIGGEPYACNHSFYGYYDRFWKKNPQCPERFVAAHPDWFAQGYTEAELKNMGGQPPQMCFSNQGFIDQVVKDARDFFDGKQAQSGTAAQGEYFGLVPMDNSSWCKCPACQAQLTRDRAQQEFSNGVASDYFFTFANKVAKEVAKTHPNKTLATLAYSEYAYYPRKVQLEPNISVQLCLHARHQWAPGMMANDLNFYNDWVNHRNGRRIYLWLYYCFPELFCKGGNYHCFPGFSAHSLDAQFKRFAHDGICGAFFNNMGEQVDIYVTMKLLDDPSLNMDSVLDEFFTRYYGAAGASLKKFYLQVERIYSDPNNYPEEVRKNLQKQHHQNEEIAWKYLGTEARMAELGKLMTEAEQANVTTIEKQRVALFRKAVWDYMVEGRKKYLAK